MIFRGLVLALLAMMACGEVAPIDKAVDAALTVDAQKAFEQIIIEAEGFDESEADTQSNEWASVPNAEASGGNVIVVAGPVGDCMVMATLGSCLPRVRYDFSLDRAGSFYVHILGIGAGASADSGWYYTDSSAEAIAATWPSDSLAFSTQPQVALQLLAGAHSLFIAHREDGTQIDVIAISDSVTPPALP